MKKEEKKSLFQENVRDIVAFGSLPFYLIVLGRTLIRTDLRIITYQLSVSLLIILIVYFAFVKFDKIELHSALVMPLFGFVNFLYQDMDFFYFSTLLFLVFIASVVYLKFDKIKIVSGLIIGIIATCVSLFAFKF